MNWQNFTVTLTFLLFVTTSNVSRLKSVSAPFKEKMKIRHRIEEKNGEMKIAHGLSRADSVGFEAMWLQTFFTAFVVTVVFKKNHFEGKLYFVTNNQKKVYQQMKKNGKVEIYGMFKGTWIRVEGEPKIIEL